MDRVLALKLDSRQRDMFDDIQLIMDDLSSSADLNLSNIILKGIMGETYPDEYVHVVDLLGKLESELYEVITRCGVTSRDISLTHVERTPLLNVLTLYIRIRL